MAGDLSKTQQLKKAAFLAAYAEVGNVTRAAEIAKVDRSMHYYWMANDPDYKDQFREAENRANDRLEQEARRRAVEGLRRLKFGKDGRPLIDPETGQPYYEHEYSDTLLIFLLKGAMPEKYKERVSAEHSGPGGGPIETKETTHIINEIVADPVIADRIKQHYRQRMGAGISKD
jgi:hypothetical protein